MLDSIFYGESYFDIYVDKLKNAKKFRPQNFKTNFINGKLYGIFFQVISFQVIRMYAVRVLRV